MGNHHHRDISPIQELTDFLLNQKNNVMTFQMLTITSMDQLNLKPNLKIERKKLTKKNLNKEVPWSNFKISYAFMEPNSISWIFLKFIHFLTDLEIYSSVRSPSFITLHSHLPNVSVFSQVAHQLQCMSWVASTLSSLYQQLPADDRDIHRYNSVAVNRTLAKLLMVHYAVHTPGNRLLRTLYKTVLTWWRRINF